MRWRWVDEGALVRLHDESIARHGGVAGLRDPALLSSALARPLNLASYRQPDAADLAATYAYGIATNHPFVDGNKRAALLALGVFLRLNGLALRASQAQTTAVIMDLAAGSMDESRLADWIRAHTVKLSPG